MRGRARCVVLLFAVLTALVCTAPVQAFSFCFSFGNNKHRYPSYNRYVPPYPPAPGMYYPADPSRFPFPGTANPYAYSLPPLQPYDALIPAPTD